MSKEPRNQLCGCGSGKKAKNCCLARVQNAKDKQQQENRSIIQRCIDVLREYGEVFPERFGNMIRARFTDNTELSRILYLKGKYDIIKVTVRKDIMLSSPAGIDEYLKMPFEDIFGIEVLLKKEEVVDV